MRQTEKTRTREWDSKREKERKRERIEENVGTAGRCRAGNRQLDTKPGEVGRG